MSKESSAAIYLLGLATFVTFLSAQLTQPILPVLADELGAGGLDIAALSGAHFIVLGLFEVFTGALADKYGKRRMISLGAFIAAVSSVLCVWALSWKQLLALRVIGALADAIVGPALLALVAEVGGQARGRAMGIFRSCQGFAFVLGPVAGGILAYSFSLHTPFFIDFGLTILGISFFLFLVPETEKGNNMDRSSVSESLRVIRREPRLLKAAFLGFTEIFAFSSLSSFIPALAIEIGLSGMEIALFLTVETIVFSLTSAFIGSLSDNVGRKPVAIAGLVYSSLNLVAFFFAAQDFFQTLFLMALYGVGASSVFLMSSTMAADILPKEGRAMLFGTFDALMDLGLVVGPSACFAFLAVTGLSIRYSFLLMAVPSLAAIVVIFKTRETKA